MAYIGVCKCVRKSGFRTRFGNKIYREFRMGRGGLLATRTDAEGGKNHQQTKNKLLDALKFHQVFNVAVGIQIIDGAAVSVRGVKLFLVEDNED